MLAPAPSPVRSLPPTRPTGKSPYPNLQEVAHPEKMTDTQTDKYSDNSEDSGVVFWNDPKTVLEMNRRMLESQMACDVIFYVGEKQEKLGAHQYVLKARSVVFDQMFTTNSSKHEFQVPDISGDHFWEVLRHIYCEEQKLQVLSVVGILAAADKYKLAALKTACLTYIGNCLEINNACYLLVEIRKYDYPDEEKTIMSFIRKNASDVFQTAGISLLSKELLDMLLNLPNIDLEEDKKKEIRDQWSKEDVLQKKILDASCQALQNDPMQDCLYVEREDNDCHRYIMDSVTSNNLFSEQEEVIIPPNAEIPPMTDEPDGMSTISSTSSLQSRSSVHTYSRLPSCNLWPELEHVTRLQEVSGCGVNDCKVADAITFSVDQDIYLFGFCIYGPKKEGEGRYKIDTILTRKKRDILMESIQIRGAGVILPVLFERPVKVDKGLPYTLETYIKGPDSHLGASGQSNISHKGMLFRFTDAVKIKPNRSKTSSGQIPRLLFMPRSK